MEQLIASLSKEEKHTYAKQVHKIKEDIQQLLFEHEDRSYFGVVNESVNDDWDKRDDTYNNL